MNIIITVIPAVGKRVEPYFHVYRVMRISSQDYHYLQKELKTPCALSGFETTSEFIIILPQPAISM